MSWSGLLSNIKGSWSNFLKGFNTFVASRGLLLSADNLCKEIWTLVRTDRMSVSHDLVPNRMTLWWCSWKNFSKILFDLILYIPVNNFSVKSEQVFLEITSTKQGLTFQNNWFWKECIKSPSGSSLVADVWFYGSFAWAGKIFEPTFTPY